MNVIAVDVGTTSVRLAIIAFGGDQAQEAEVVASYKKDIDHFQDGNKFEQSSSQVWRAICDCSKQCIKMSGISPDSIKSIAFSATCSLVIVNNENASEKNDIIMWMDHRAVEQAQLISESDSKVLNQFGGKCSPEFSLAKLLWIKQTEPDLFDDALGFFELPDWLVYRCIGGTPACCPRSLCCVTCKWGYDAETKCYPETICDLDLTRISSKIGQIILEPGKVAGMLSMTAANELGLVPESDGQDKENLNIAVGASLIDAHAGMLAMLSLPLEHNKIDKKIHSTFCSLAGTSSCHMLLTKTSKFTQGIWGPYSNVVIDGYYLLEAGQSLTGKLIEICIESHIEGKARLSRGESMYAIIASLNQQLCNVDTTCELHVLPTFHGNRSPLANPRLRGGVYGLSAEGPKSLLHYYEATIYALAYETKFIVTTLDSKLDTVLISGGLMKNDFFMQTLSDVLQCPTIRVSLIDVDFMVMGSGLVARHAALSVLNLSDQAQDSVKPLTRESITNIEYEQLDLDIYRPNKDRFKHHEKRYLCYREFVELSQRIDKIMNTAC